jgi:plasmid stabilization system protein ParE
MNLVFTEKADQDLEEVRSTLQALETTEEGIDQIFKRILLSIETLVTFPNAGPVLYAFNGFDTGYRYLESGDYLCFYRISIQKTIIIERILPKKMNCLHLLLGTENPI